MKKIEEIYILYRQDIYRYILYLTNNPDLSEDLLSETFVNAIISIKGFKGRSSVKTWLFSIARHLWLQRFRKEKQTIEYNDFLGLYLLDSMDEKLITEEITDRIKELLSEKDGRTQKIVNMRIEGYSFAEIAEEMDISEGSARVINFRARKWIKNVLDEEGLN